MKNLRLFAFATGSLLISTGVLLACSDDDSVVTTPGADGGDGGTDSSRDNNVAPDADAGVADVVTDTNPDVITDAGLKLETFANELASVMCDTLSRCCFGAPNDGGTTLDGGGKFNRAACENFYDGIGFDTSLVGFRGIQSNAALDQGEAAACLQKVRAMTCSVTGTEYNSIRGSCYAAIKGKATASQACTNSVDCAQGTYCKSTDGGPGTCAALAGDGGACGVFDTGDQNTDLARADEVCSWKAGGVPKQFCDSIDFVSGVRPKAEWRCAPGRPNGGDCANTNWCSDGICNPDTLACTSPLGLYPQVACGQFVTP